ncbi:hypothetical protein [Listeria kieliensis]|uniref:hypothetical protein n=1 Tax=Listeria kieliensis TaxID=1621700 RepID=UPI00105876ED|nr:hypothetical protein [Listeria kieliensis]
MPEIKIYQFGSSLCSDTPNDLDILIIYKFLDLNEIDEVIRFKNEIKLKIETALLIPVDVVLLSEDEAVHLQYLEKVVFQRIF